MKSMHSILLGLNVLFLLACFVACGPDRPDSILSDSEMEDVLYDYHAAKALGDIASPSDKYKVTLYYLNVFEKHHTTEQQFDSTLAWYSRNPEAFDKVYQKVIKRMQDEKTVLERSLAISGQSGDVMQRGDSVNLWTNLPMFSLTNHPYDNRVDFLYTNAVNFEDKDTLHFNANFRYFMGKQSIGSSEAAVMSLSIRYRNDSIISKLHHIYGDGQHTLTLQNGSYGKIREVYGFIYFPEQRENRILLVDRVSLIRIHAKDQ
ncbi:MAG: DUF4296 domain-containing protein [Bacteroidaceae bacterium]|nr:DUF4296 domain-containing protein [Bacteroidaceae bacterium]